MKLLSMAWVDFTRRRKYIVGQTTVDINEANVAFYAGASAVIMALRKSAEEDPSGEGMITISAAIIDELDEKFERKVQA